MNCIHGNNITSGGTKLRYEADASLRGPALVKTLERDTRVLCPARSAFTFSGVAGARWLGRIAYPFDFYYGR